MDQKAAIEIKVESLLSSMTLEEKIGHMSQVRHFDGVTEEAGAWLPGSEANGVSEVLFVVHNFKCKIPHSWPRSEDDFKGKYRPNFWDDTLVPLFRLGYGLRYE